MKLELKYLAPYLPYGLNIKTDAFWVKEVNGYRTLPSGKISILTNDTHVGFSEELRLVLRPLSDLTKENVMEMIEYSDFENVYFNGNPSDLIFINTEEKNYLSDIIRNVEFLFRNHFDVFGLIEKGLAIDINNLNK